MSFLRQYIGIALAWLLIINFISACSRSGNGSGNELSDSLRAANLIQLDDQSWCDSLDGYGICPIGVYFVQIGDSLAPDSMVLPEGVTVESSGMNTRVLFPNGEVQIETDSARYVQAIRIRSALFKTRHGIGIGSELAELTGLYPGLSACLVSQPPQLHIIAVGAPNIVYLFDAANLGLRDSLPDVSSLPANLKVGEIHILP